MTSEGCKKNEKLIKVVDKFGGVVVSCAGGVAEAVEKCNEFYKEEV